MVTQGYKDFSQPQGHLLQLEWFFNDTWHEGKRVRPDAQTSGWHRLSPGEEVYPLSSKGNPREELSCQHAGIEYWSPSEDSGDRGQTVQGLSHSVARLLLQLWFFSLLMLYFSLFEAEQVIVDSCLLTFYLESNDFSTFNDFSKHFLREYRSSLNIKCLSQRVATNNTVCKQLFGLEKIFHFLCFSEMNLLEQDFHYRRSCMVKVCQSALMSPDQVNSQHLYSSCVSE